MSKTQLALRIIVMTVGLALIPLYALGGAIYYYFNAVHQDMARTDLRSRVENRANAIQVFLDERTAQLEVLAHASSLEELVQPGRIKSFLAVLNRRSQSYLDLGVIDSEGQHLAYVGPYALADVNYKDDDWFKQAMSRGVFVSDVFLGHRAVPHFIIAVRQSEGEKPWILRATIDSVVFTNLLRGVQVGRTGDAYIVSREGGLLQTPSRFGAQVLAASGLEPKTIPAGTSVIDRRDAAGRERLTALAWLSKSDWLLVIDQDPQEGLDLLARARHLEMIILGLGSLLIVVAVFFLVRILLRQLEASEREKAALDAELVNSSRLAALGRMAAGVAHEINNPLAAIGELSGLLDDLMDPELVKSHPYGAMFKETAGKIQHHVDRARSVTHRLLGYARRMEPTRDTVDLNQVVTETVSFLEKEAHFRRVAIIQVLDPGLGQTVSDRSQLQQVFLNLLNNALDAVADGGQIVITSQAVKDQLIVTFADDGGGMDAETMKRVFDPFFTTKPQGKGTGLGLYICHSIIHKLGGSLTVSSAPGQGATFAVRLPRVAPEIA
jgi:two-component system NtrC family sensor kinase